MIDLSGEIKVIICDRCKCETGPFIWRGLDDLLETAKGRGWIVEDDGRALCPECRGAPRGPQEPIGGPGLRREVKR